MFSVEPLIGDSRLNISHVFLGKTQVELSNRAPTGPFRKCSTGSQRGSPFVGLVINFVSRSTEVSVMSPEGETSQQFVQHKLICVSSVVIQHN